MDFRQGPEIVDKLKEKGFVGLKAIRPAYPYDDERYFPYYERAEKLNMPIVFHTGVISRANRSMLSPGLSTCSSNMRPGYAMGIASAFPDLTIVLAHLGVPWGEEAFCAALSHSNIYLDLSGGQSEFKVRWLNEYLHRGVAEKLLLSVDATYGRDQYHNDVLHMLNFWNDYFNIVLKRHEAYRHKDSIFRGTALSLIKKCLSN